jgi:F0F1-type ATP synthase alpha subunit
MGEFFRDRGNMLVHLYDLSKQARHIARFAPVRRPPAREEFPGDISHNHSRQLERPPK